MFNLDSDIICLKNQAWFENQKIAGKCVSHVLKECTNLVRLKTPNLTLRDLEKTAVSIISTYDCLPTFLGYKGFPGAVCLSVNEQLVHGIPSDYVLQDGDKISIDLGATYNSAIADAAFTSIYGEPRDEKILEMMRLCQASLDKAIQSVAIGNHIGCIGAVIHKNVKDSDFGLIVQYGGHGINENKPHASPFIANKALSTDGVRIQAGLTIAIEPMLVLGPPKTRVLSDNWTVVTQGVGCHFEHTIFVAEDKIHIMTEHGMKV